ncbi:glycosyltransferase family 9 protein, partial [Candidatus Latescibacterota bacterium]
IVIIGGKGEGSLIADIKELSDTPVDILKNVSIGQMAAVIERCDMFISNDTGPMHVSAALGRPTIGIFVSSDFRIYSPRGKHGRIVDGSEGNVSVDDVLLSVKDLLESGK